MTGHRTPPPLAPDLEAVRVAAEFAGAGNDPFAAAVRSTHMPMIVTDPRRPDNPVVFANNAFCRLTGYAREEVLGRNCRFLQGPDTSAEALARLRAAIDAVAPLKIDLRNYRKDGEPFWNRLMMAPVRDAAGDLAYFVASQVDITVERDRLDGLESHNAKLIVELREANVSLERQVAERTAALHASEARLRAVFDTSYQLQCLLDVDGRVLDANSTLLALLRAPIEEVRGQPFWRTPWFATTEGLPAKVEAAVSTVAGGESVRLELTAATPVGLRAYDVSLRPVRDRAGTVTGMVPEAIDITERLAAEDQLRQAQKMEAVGQLTGGIAHDFNNLLMGVIGSLEMLQRRLDAGRSDGVARYVAAANTSAQRAAALTQRLLAFARRQPLDSRRVDANRLILGMEDLLRRTLGASVELAIVEGEGLWPILCDPNQLESAILNLVINARDAMPDGGRVTISTSNAVIDDAPAQPGDILEPGDYAVVRVCDTGDGMAPDVVSKIFDPFFTTKPIGQGTGLGLSMVYGFVRQSSGVVRVDSSPGEGASFELRLPRFEGRAAEAEPARVEPVPSARAKASEAVLVVEDEPAVRTLVVETLHALGYVVFEASDGPQGLQILRSGVRIDLLVTDVGLPGLNGRRLSDAARVLRPDLKVLFMTGFVHDADIGGGAELEPGTEILSKPFALDALASRVRGMINAAAGAPPRS